MPYCKQRSGNLATETVSFTEQKELKFTDIPTDITAGGKHKKNIKNIISRLSHGCLIKFRTAL
jgi:hypothetical protein